MSGNNVKQSDITKDFIAGLQEINKLEKGASLIGIASVLLKHIGPYVQSVKFSGTRIISKPSM